MVSLSEEFSVNAGTVIHRSNVVSTQECRCQAQITSAARYAEISYELTNISDTTYNQQLIIIIIIIISSIMIIIIMIIIIIIISIMIIIIKHFYHYFQNIQSLIAKYD